MSWWMSNDLRLIQCNLREIDAQMDADRLIRDIEDFHANVLMVGAGGISAFYPTELPFQHKNPYLRSDMLGELTEKCHQKGIRIIARFDFSKAHESFLSEHPDWFYRSLKGKTISFNGMVHTCVNGEYQQRLSLEMIREVLEKYPVDGIFFNMFGYQTRDYSEQYHGICQCENCRKKFLEFSGRELPTREDDPDISEYRRFQKATIHDLMMRIRALVKSIRPDIAICTYTDDQVDLIRAESNSALSRPLPFWIYSASDNVMSVMGSFPDKRISNCAINAADIFYRFMGVSEHLTKLRLLQNMAAGSGLDYCIIGVFDGYPETAPFEGVKEIFQYKERTAEQYRGFRSEAPILLIKPAGSTEEYRGIFRALKEAHLIFDVAQVGELESCRRNYRLVIAPDVYFDAALFPDADILATGPAFADNPDQLRSLFGGTRTGTLDNLKSAYLDVQDKSLWKRFPKRDQVLLDGTDFPICSFEQEILPVIPPSRYGPPELCYGAAPSHFCGGGIRRREEKAGILLPFLPGTLYYRYGYQEHRDLLLDLIDHCGIPQPLQTDAPAMTEITFARVEGGWLIHLINLTGFNGSTFFPPIPLRDLHISCHVEGCQSVRSLKTEKSLEFQKFDGEISFTIKELTDYDVIFLSLLPEEG